MYPTKISYYLGPEYFVWRMKETEGSAVYAVEHYDGKNLIEIGTATAIGTHVVSMTLDGNRADMRATVTDLLQAAISKSDASPSAGDELVDA